ncbi:MAG: protein kinase [bacterium]|nr:protein kinase [bacterium]
MSPSSTLPPNNPRASSSWAGRPYITPLVGPIQGKGATDVFTRTRTDGGNTLIDLGIQFDLNSPPWLGPRGGATRTGGLAQGYTAYKEAQLELLRRHLDETIKQAKDMARQGKWAEASQTIATGVLAASPSHAEALRLHRYYLIREHLILIILVGLLALALLGWLVWAAWRISRRLVVENLARRAVGAGNQARAVRLYYRLCQLYPRRGAYYGQLADLLIELKRLGAEAAPIYEHAHAAFPGEDRYLKALATAYSAIPRFDEPAAIVYSEMARITKNAGPWFFILGQALMKIGRDAEALEAFRQAIVLHHEDPQLPVYMSDLFIRLGITAPEILSTLDRVLDQRQEDRAFLRTYCLACQEARRYDDQAQQVAEWLLAQDPASPPAHVILATRLLQTGLQKEAMLHAQQILQVAPNDAVGLRLLGACYAAEHRLDKTAMQIFAKALQANPDAPEILIAVSHGFIQDKRTDPEACAIYRKALVHNPNDETILGQLAAIAARENDDDLTIRTVEPLLEMGRQSRDLILQLANAYCRLGIVEDKAEPIYREALKHQPDHATIQDNLAAIYLRKGRTDAEATAIFELVYQRHPDRFDIGLQLVRCYHGAERPEKALELGRGLQALEPDNADLTKLLASASERADQMESAIAGYESVLTDHPDDHEAIRALSLLFGRKRLSDNHAIEVHNRAIQLEPNEPLHYLAAARAYAARESWESVVQIAQHMLTRLPGQVGEIIALLESLVEAAPKAFHLRRYLVDSLIFEGRLRDARRHLGEILSLDAGQADYILEALDRILEKNPKDAMAHLERGRLLLTMGRERDARRAIEQAHRYNPENEEIIRSLMTLYQKMLEKRDSAEVRFQLGRLAMRMDKYDLAISCFQQTSRDYRWEGESVRSLGRCFVAKGMLDLALQELKRLPLEHDVKEQLYELGQRYEAVQDIQGAREVYKLIFASDITFRDVKGKLETLAEAGQAGAFNVERTAIINSLSEEAKRRYELVQELGRGSMGIVYKARDNELDEFVALKILPDNLIRNTEAVRRFKQEARNARRLAHPNIVRIHDIGEELGRKYISMEFVEGTDLKNKLRQMRRKLPFATSLRYARQICEAMAYAHSIGIVHRDIKPANLMLTKDDQIKVTDFGIAKMVESTQASDATSTGLIIGTPLYMSPEQVKGQQVDHRADIYSIGVVFYEMASGYPPFTEGDLSYQHLFVEPKPLKGVPEPFATIVMKCLAKEKDQRPQRVQEILAELNRIDPSEIPFV